ncbi:heme exporter protein D [Aliiruegeria haliotis]|uniref:Heme exporter protein D n=1 Tax=Aliiruegeria haliotis TaxID=1280846 RepID=A0A2T0RYJ8_9RHOB|nr:heme exporter protein CcmD [Aliiruegeria haliotis]PRY26255.1 heme exporter protein D [Aliiruegeria haliotis]
MMPDLGKYAADVLAAYAVSLGLIAVLLIVSLRQSRKTRTALRQVEESRQAKASAQQGSATGNG